MKILKIFGLLIIIVSMGACSTVKSINQLGEATYPLNEDEWNGTWVTGDGAIQLKVADNKTSKIEMMFIEKDKIERYFVFIKKSDGSSYMNLVDKDKSYFIAKFKKKKNMIIVWKPSMDMIEKAINNKYLVGTINKNDDILIRSDSKTLNKYFSDNNDKMLFEYEDPVIFRRLVE